MLRDAGNVVTFLEYFILKSYLSPQVQRFTTDVIGPKVREMDEKESMDPSIIKALFEQGVSIF
jgi:hypothetical protein